jgi:hypothetical protein
MKRVKSVCSCGLEEHTEYEDVPEMKFKSWAEWRKLPVEKRWEALKALDRLSYDHSASWIEGAMEESRRENEAKRLEWARKIDEQLESYGKDNAVFRISVFYREMKALAEKMKDGTR